MAAILTVRDFERLRDVKERAYPTERRQVPLPSRDLHPPVTFARTDHDIEPLEPGRCIVQMGLPQQFRDSGDERLAYNMSGVPIKRDRLVKLTFVSTVGSEGFWICEIPSVVESPDNTHGRLEELEDCFCAWAEHVQTTLDPDYVLDTPTCCPAPSIPCNACAAGTLPEKFDVTITGMQGLALEWQKFDPPLIYDHAAVNGTHTFEAVGDTVLGGACIYRSRPYDVTSTYVNDGAKMRMELRLSGGVGNGGTFVQLRIPFVHPIGIGDVNGNGSLFIEPIPPGGHSRNIPQSLNPHYPSPLDCTQALNWTVGQGNPVIGFNERAIRDPRFAFPVNPNGTTITFDLGS